MKKWLVCAALIVVVGGVIGCATPVQEQQSALQKKGICCHALLGFTYSDLKFGEEYKLRIDADSPVYEFDAHKRYFAALMLPDRSGREIHIKSYFNGFLIGQYLNPNILLLDENHEVVGRLSVPMQFNSGDLFGDQNAHMYGFVRVPDSARHLVIYGRQPDEGAAVATLHSGPMAYSVGGTFVYTPASSSTKSLEFSPTGELKIWVKAAP